MTASVRSDPQMWGRRSMLARTLWVVLAAGYLLIWLASLPGFYERASTLTVEPYRLGERVIFDNNTARQEASGRGLSLPANAAYDIAYDMLQILVLYVVAAVILRRVSSSFGWFTAMVLMGLGVVSMSGAVGVAQPFPGASLLVEIPGYLVWPFLALWLYLFPDGRALPRWTRVPVIGILAAFLLLQLASVLAVGGMLPPQVDTFGATVGPILGLPLFGLILFARIYRYRRLATPLERQQTKWFVGSVIVLVVLLAAFGVLGNYVPNPYVQDIASAVLLGFPISVAFAILRYRLWDIDIIIRRTLIYGTLTAVLALVYLGSVVLLQQVLRPFVGRENDLAVVASTLAIAAIFQPLRRRIQATIDRRFYRRRYDAARTLMGFGLRLRDEVEMDVVTNDLLAVVEETLQPVHASLWLREGTARARHQ